MITERKRHPNSIDRFHIKSKLETLIGLQNDQSSRLDIVILAGANFDQLTEGVRLRHRLAALAKPFDVELDRVTD